MDVMTDWRAAFDAFSGQEGAKWAAEERAAAFARFEAHGAPARRHEYWKQTPVRGFTPDVSLATRGGDAPFADVDAFRIVFVDGVFAADRSDWDQLAEAVDLGDDWTGRVLAKVQTTHTKVARPMADLNLAMFNEGLALRVPAGVTVHRPIHLRYEGSTPAHLRLILLVEEGAEATIIESGAGALTTGAEIVVEKGATLHHLRAQTEVADKQFTNVFADIGEGAALNSFSLSVDAALIRNETIVTHSGPNGRVSVAAAMLGRDGSLVDNTVYVSHEAEDCESRQIVKAVIDEDAKGVFQGKIFVTDGAQRTDGYQISQAVLLSENGVFFSKPELEIYADDVKCSHGCTTGALDETAMFYLRSRGVPQRAAEAMLVAAFVDEAVGEIANETLQDLMRDHVAAWMAARA